MKGESNFFSFPKPKSAFSFAHRSTHMTGQPPVAAPQNLWRCFVDGVRCCDILRKTDIAAKAAGKILRPILLNIALYRP